VCEPAEAWAQLLMLVVEGNMFPVDLGVVDTAVVYDRSDST
jgi:hypothetical protein